jgi:hypothetical protein
MLYNKEKIEKLQHRWTTTQGKKLLKTIKESRCFLSPVLFKEKIRNFPGIKDKEVSDSIDLRGAPLSGFDFRVPIQEDDDGFSEDIAILSEIHFEGAILKHCNFQDGKIHDCFFEHADVSHSDFKGSSINSCQFHEADCLGMNLRGARLINCNFSDANIRDITLDATIVDENTTFGEELKTEKENSHHAAAIEYKQIKEMYKNSSLHNLSDKYHYKEMIAKRKKTHKHNPMRWLNFAFGDLLCKYGTSFIRVFLWSVVLMVVCAIVYTQTESLLFQNNVVDHSFSNSLYFSIVTFTTLGYGDFHAIGAARFLAAMESFLGAALMSLFTVIVARHIIRD